nr:PREDICTED: alpha-glucosidase-like [Bemisia tabaci]XP_018910377.1 PREDICTED: alpha-glucosidase-like [Bemisia tabaci]XP_018910378.1 PREDICTED: alpha-glucosidase-like [Bemisia tabaci]XP_018910379.1 PREDICTED: alpha-glucosidase-like [Bemisia tabaci]
MQRVLYFVIFVLFLFGQLDSRQTAKAVDWWENTIIYQIYPRSFKDSNGDGLGDLNGIYEKLDYVKELGVGTIWIQPFYKSPMIDMGYDITDFRAVDPIFGTMDDFKRLVQGVHERGMKVILDFVPNHTSDTCEWFKLSERRIEPYTDFYVWQDPKQLDSSNWTYPNNWVDIPYKYRCYLLTINF